MFTSERVSTAEAIRLIRSDHMESSSACMLEQYIPFVRSVNIAKPGVSHPKKYKFFRITELTESNWRAVFSVNFRSSKMLARDNLPNKIGLQITRCSKAGGHLDNVWRECSDTEACQKLGAD